MGMRDRAIGASILRAIFKDNRDDNKTVLARILAFFTLFDIPLSRYDAELFAKLRVEVWEIDEEEYREAFRRGEKKARLKPVGDLGYSGSTFFSTPNSKYLIKSLPRPSEYNFFKKELLKPYTRHMELHPDSLLVRITDFLHTRYICLGSILSLAPSHHIIMENILYGQETDEAKDRWETYDLKPIDYFYPERDLAGGRLASDDVIDRLVDKFEDRIRLTSKQRDELLNLLDRDTKLLESCNVVDYSLFLIRYPPSSSIASTSSSSKSNRESETNPWRTGLPSKDGKWIYRATVLDFFWAKHSPQAKFMTGLINSFNVFARKGPMSITAEAREYQQRFMGMVNGFLEFDGDDDDDEGGEVVGGKV